MSTAKAIHVPYQKVCQTDINSPDALLHIVNQFLQQVWLKSIQSFQTLSYEKVVMKYLKQTAGHRDIVSLYTQSSRLHLYQV